MQTLDNWPEAISAWNKALRTLPSSNLTASEQKLKEEYNIRKKGAKKMIEKLKDSAESVQSGHIPVTQDQISTLPWLRAKDMIPELKSRGETRSSVSHPVTSTKPINFTSYSIV